MSYKTFKTINPMDFFRFKVCRKCYNLEYQKDYIQCGNKDLCKCKTSSNNE